MLWKKITLDGYIPFTHVGNHHVEVEFDQPCCAILGGNGSGKSSMLREMTPYPSCRTDYMKDGRIEKVIEHRGHIYTLTSDFKNATAPHSFKKDDQELNPSGTSDVQIDLVEEIFGINKMISDIMAGNIHICSMQKSLRKQLFSATYPSDLSFVLEYHKKVCSQIRAFANQIKLLQGREGSLEASLITSAERDRMHQYRDCYQTILDRVDKANFLLENEINQLKDHEVLKKQQSNLTLDDLKKLITTIVRHYQEMLVDRKKGRKLGESPTIHSTHEKVIAHQASLRFLREKESTRTHELESLRDELNKFIRVRDAPTSDKKDELASELVVLEQEMKSLQTNPSWKNIPPIQADKMDKVEDIVVTVTNLITSLHPYCGRLINQEQIDKLRGECDTLSFSIANVMGEKSILEGQLAQQRSRKEMMTQNSYPKDCSRVCGLRATLEASVRDIDLRCSEIEARLKKIYEEVSDNEKRLNESRRHLLEVSPAIPIMKSLWEKLSENYLLDLALNGESFIDCVNNHCTEIPNRIIKGYESSKIYYRYKDLYNKSEQIKNTLAMMKSNEAINLSMEVIHEMIADRQKKLDLGIKEIDELVRQIRIVENDLDLFVDAEDTLRSIDTYIQVANDVLNREIILNRIAFDRKMIDEHIQIKNEIGRRLREIEHTLEEQKRIEDVLNTEIRPTLEDLRKQKIDWELVESGLSPTKGLPCIYLVRFMNRLISRANAIIKEVWSTDMELGYIEEKDSLDFSISVIFNKSTIVKDCSLCSNGQKAIVDLAMTLALAIERGFINWMPLICDEVDGALTDQHRTSLVGMINRLLEEGVIKQMFIVNHFAIQTGLPNCSIVALSTDGVLLPCSYNEHAKIE